MVQITADRMHLLFEFPQLIDAIETGFKSEITVPTRLHYNFPNPLAQQQSTLLLMPAWENGCFLGVKVIIVAPENQRYGFSSIQGTYILFDASNGSPLAMMDAKVLTNYRTAATSALASRFLSRANSKTLLMVGTGALAPYLIKAHASVRPIEKVYIWGRDFDKAQKLASSFDSNTPFQAEAIDSIETGISNADIVSVATFSGEPLIFGKYLKAGQHIDLVGSFKPDMREADDETLLKSEIFVDVVDGATKESGDLVIPLKTGVIGLNDIQGDLFSLCKHEVMGRQSEASITLFKSVGFALEDLVAAALLYDLNL